MKNVLALCLLGCAALAAQSPFPATPTALPDHPYFIKKTWVIGGQGNWDYLTADPAAERLYVAHGHEIQVVDVKTGDLAGVVDGFGVAHAIALDRSGEFGFVSDGGDSSVAIFDRRTLKVEAKVAVKSGPRALVYDSQTEILMAVSAGPTGAPAPDAGAKVISQWEQDEADKARYRARMRDYSAVRGRKSPEPPENPCEIHRQGNAPAWQSLLTFIDPAAHSIVAEATICGFAGPAVADDMGHFYTVIANSGEILRFDAAEILSSAKSGALSLDWRSAVWHRSIGVYQPIDGFAGLEAFNAGAECRYPKALALDGAHLRLFAACANKKFVVLDAGAGKNVAILDIETGVEQIGYDAAHGQIYSANGGGDGNLTIIHQDVADSYHVTQLLPTRKQARTIAVNSSSGEVYLVTAVHSVENQMDDRTGKYSLKLVPQDASFQVLVVGN